MAIRACRTTIVHGAALMITLSLFDIFMFLLRAVRWTLLLAGIAFAGGGISAVLLLLFRYSWPRFGGQFVRLYVDLFQGTPLLLQLFLVFFGLPLIGIEVSPLLAAGTALTLYASAFLVEIWRGCVDSIPRGQWDASASLGLRFVMQMRLVILPQALRVAVPPTVGFLVQLVKSTALASIVGFDELTRSGQIVANATFEPFTIYGLVALIYFVICYPLSEGARRLEMRLGRSR
jgi:polar amino acid transport system permease protein